MDFPPQDVSPTDKRPINGVSIMPGDQSVPVTQGRTDRLNQTSGPFFWEGGGDQTIMSLETLKPLNSADVHKLTADIAILG